MLVQVSHRENSYISKPVERYYCVPKFLNPPILNVKTQVFNVVGNAESKKILGEWGGLFKARKKKMTTKCISFKRHYGNQLVLTEERVTVLLGLFLVIPTPLGKELGIRGTLFSNEHSLKTEYSWGGKLRSLLKLLDQVWTWVPVPCESA